MKIILTFLYLTLFIHLSIYPQEENINFKWDKLTNEEIAIQSAAFEPEAPAINLFRKWHMYFNTLPNGSNLFIIYEEHTRIKFLANYQMNSYSVTIPYNDISLDYEYLIKVKAQTYNLDESGKYKKERVKKSNIEHKKIDKYRRSVTINFTNIKPGTIIEYSITKPSLDFEDPKDYYFEDKFPTVYSTFEATVPDVFQYILKSENVDTFDIFTEKQLNQTISWYGKVYRYPTHRYAGMRFKSLNFNSTKYSFTIKNVHSYTNQSNNDLFPALKPKMIVHLLHAERQETNSSQVVSIYSDWEELTKLLVSSLEFRFDSMSWDQRKNMTYPAGYILYKLPTWEEINRDLLKSKSFGFPLRTYWEYKNILDSIIKQEDSYYEKMKNIYDFIKNHMDWNGKYSIFLNAHNNPDFPKLKFRINKMFNNENKYVDQTLYKPFTERSGSSSEINMLLIYLLQKANLKADPVLISTIDNGRVDTSLHIFSQLNHVICRVKIEDKTYFLDAIEKDIPYNVLPKNDMNGLGWLVRFKDPHWVPVRSSDEAVVKSQINILIDKNKNIIATLINQLQGYEALYYRHNINNFLFDFTFKTTNKKILEENGIIQEIADFNLNTTSNSYSFVPIQLNTENALGRLVKTYPYSHQYQLIIEHNDNITIKNYPKSVNVSSTGRKFSFIVNTQNLPDKLIITYRLTQNFPYSLKDEQQQLLAFLNVIDEKLKEYIAFEIN